MISRTDYDMMIDELLNQEPASFNMLCLIAEKTLKSGVKRWCAADTSLAGRNHEDDIMQEIYIRLIKTTVSHFLLRDGIDKPINNDPDGFEDWMFKVARNIKNDYAYRMRKITVNNDELDDNEDYYSNEDELQDIEAQQQHQELLKNAFAIVMNSDVQIYKVLTWLAQCIFIINLDITKIKSNEIILQEYESKTLFEMRDDVIRCADKIDWLHISETQAERINESLNKPFDKDRKYGEIRYREFFMKKGGKATISDWVNRMNTMIKQVMTNETLNS